MTIHEVLLITYACDIPSCGNELACGSDHNFAEKQGWHPQVPIGDKTYDLCPNCAADLDIFTKPVTEEETKDS